jgi:hypothetical protein
MTVRRSGSFRYLLRGACLVCFGLTLAGLATGQQPPKTADTPAPRPAQTLPEGPRWNQLSAAQRQALGPLKGVWDTLDGPRKRKWLEVAQRFPSMGEDERRRVHDRMGEWVALSPQQRTLARINFRTAKEVPASQRLDRWESYQSLSPEERQALATQAQKLEARNAPTPRQPASVPVSATTKQVRPGATTVPVTQRPQPTWHQQPGLPKIATSSRFIDPQTLLPVAGPQGAAATRPAAPPAKAPRPASP